MIDRSRKALVGLIAFAFLTLTGCPPPATPKPEETTPPEQAQAPDKQETAGPIKEPPTGETSLKETQQGQKPVTPPSSPLKEIYFEYNLYDLASEARDTLKANATWLRSNGSVRVEIEGHCDERGTNEYNLALGAKRAQAAKDYLVTLGIPAERISTISYGKELPVCQEHTEECWQKNRRDRFVIMTARPAS